jgi:ABC-type branched-subunit amino acid transport system substrate-binding protein
MRLTPTFTQYVLQTSLCAAVLCGSAIAAGADSTPLLQAQVNQRQEMLKGAKAYFDAVNARGGVHGRSIHLAPTEIAPAPMRSAQAANAPVSISALPVVNAQSSSALFALRPNYAQEVNGLVDQLFALYTAQPATTYPSAAFDKRWLNTPKPLPTDSSLPLVREYQQAMASAGYGDLSALSLEGYINAKVVAEGLRRAGRSLIAQLDKQRNYTLGALAVAVDERITQASPEALAPRG